MCETFGMSHAFDTVSALLPKPLDFVEVAVLERGGIIESRHRGIGALVDPEGKLIDHLGSAKRLIYARSAVKPLQVVAMRRAGLMLEGAQLAVSAASHQGTPQHIALVEAILSGAGLGPDALQCPVAWPGNAAARAEAQAKGETETRLAFNCSGKHAAFLAASVAAGFDTETYLNADHPLQKLVEQVIEEYSGEKILHTTIDGCGAPLHTITVEGLARAIAKFTATDIDVVDAMLANPWAVGDTNSMDALVMKHGMVAKIGAEGVFVIGLKSGHGVAVKVADGSLRAAPLVALALLHRNQLITDTAFGELKTALAVKSLGGSQVVGELKLVV
jgi:L-asparaginase II